jgi:hypothetical protein
MEFVNETSDGDVYRSNRKQVSSGIYQVTLPRRHLKARSQSVQANTPNNNQRIMNP